MTITSKIKAAVGRIHAVPNGRKLVPRRYTFRALAAIATVQGAWAAVPALQAALPPVWVQGITLALAVAGAVGAFIDQPRAR